MAQPPKADATFFKSARIAVVVVDVVVVVELDDVDAGGAVIDVDDEVDADALAVSSGSKSTTGPEAEGEAEVAVFFGCKLFWPLSFGGGRFGGILTKLERIQYNELKGQGKDEG